MLFVDVILLILLVGFFIRGWQAGLIRMLAGLIGILAGIILAGHFSPVVSSWLIKLPFLTERENLAKVFSILIIFFSVSGLVGIGAYMVDSVFHIFTFIPFLKTFNRLAGGVLGLLAGVFIFGFLITTLNKFPLVVFITQYLENSQVVPYVLMIHNLILPFWPQAIKQIKGIIS